MPKEYTTIKLFRTILLLWDLDTALESGVDFEDAEPASADYVNFISDEDVLVQIKGILEFLQGWVTKE